MTISGNTVYNNRTYAKEAEGYWVRAGIWLTYQNQKTFQNDTGHENITIAGNTVVNGPGKRRAIWIGCGKNILVRGNQLIGAPLYHGGRHGDSAGKTIMEYDASRDYSVNSRGEISALK